MQKQIYKNNLTVNYNTEGEGDALLLIHGFLETHEIWDQFNKDLSKHFKVISIDLPGHGRSTMHSKPYTMCKYAESVFHILESEKIDTVFMIGHSMGGYIAMAFTENYPEKLSGLCLFHSTPFADSKEKKEQRNQMIKDILFGKKIELCENHCKNVYAKDNISSFEKEIEKGVNIAKNLKQENIIASVETMRDRKDRSELLKNCTVPFLYILGLKDQFIPKSILDFIDMPKTNEIFLLENSGHMGMIEEKERSVKAVLDFHTKYIVQKKE